MAKLLINLLVFSLGFAVVAARHHEKISFRLGGRIALMGLLLLGLTAILGMMIGHQSLEKTFLVLDSSNDHQMGVIYGMSALYISAMCCLWSFSRYLQERSKREVK